MYNEILKVQFLKGTFGGKTVTTFGKKSVIYRYEEICTQQLYNSYGNIVIELHMRDGRAVQLQAGMVLKYLGAAE